MHESRQKNIDRIQWNEQQNLEASRHIAPNRGIRCILPPCPITYSKSSERGQMNSAEAIAPRSLRGPIRENVRPNQSPKSVTIVLIELWSLDQNSSIYRLPTRTIMACSIVGSAVRGFGWYRYSSKQSASSSMSRNPHYSH